VFVFVVVVVLVIAGCKVVAVVWGDILAQPVVCNGAATT
jgi:hypothetical protein